MVRLLTAAVAHAFGSERLPVQTNAILRRATETSRPTKSPCAPPSVDPTTHAPLAGSSPRRRRFTGRERAAQRARSHLPSHLGNLSVLESEILFR